MLKLNHEELKKVVGGLAGGRSGGVIVPRVRIRGNNAQAIHLPPVKVIGGEVVYAQAMYM